MEGRLLLDIVICESTTILELFASEDEVLLVRGDIFFILDLGLHIVYGVGEMAGGRVFAREVLMKI